MLWLEETVKEVLRRVDAKDPVVEDCQNKSAFIFFPCSFVFFFLTLEAFVDDKERQNLLWAGSYLCT